QTVVVIAQPGPALERTQEVIKALGEIGAVVIQVGSAADGCKTPPMDEVLAPVVNVVPLQLFAYEASRRLGVEADSFRRDEPPYAAAQARFTLSAWTFSSRSRRRCWGSRALPSPST